MRQRLKDDERQKPLEQGFVNLARMARQAVGSREDNGPGDVSRAAPEFRANEVGDSAKEDANRRDERAQVKHSQRRRFVAAAEQEDADQRADQPAVKGHAAFPDFEDLDRMGKVILWIVEQNDADPPADDDAKGAIDQEIVDAVGAWALCPIPIPLVGHDPANEQPTQDKAGDIGERVPADRQRTPLHEHRIDRWKRQNKCWHRGHADALGPARRQVGALDRELEAPARAPGRLMVTYRSRKSAKSSCHRRSRTRKVRHDSVLAVKF